MAQLSAWMGAGVVAAGVSAAMIAGADTATADTGSGTTGGTAGASDTAAERHSAKPPKRETEDADTTDSDTKDSDTKDADTKDADADSEDAGVDDAEAGDADADDASDPAEESVEPDVEVGPGPDPSGATPVVDDEDTTEPESNAAQPVGTTELPEDQTKAPASTDPQPAQDAASPEPQSAPSVDQVAAQRVSATVEASATSAEAPPRTLQDVLQSLFTEIIGAAIRFVAGPPVVPAGVNVTVRTSRLEITEGRFVSAHWYYPDGTELPERFIYLQHGFRGVGAMYSKTASWLAECTNSIVVVPTLSSNPLVRDGFWLGDDQVYRATADLLLGDRDALMASAVAAGFARKYGAEATLPQRFTLVGHSLGAGVAAGAAGYYADAVAASGAVNQLAGIVTLDGAPPGSVLADALDKLESLGAYVPVIELGAPRKDGTPRRVDAALNDHRPGHFNGVVLDDGQHLDSMQGGSWAIQLISYLNQGFPTEQNKEAAQTLIAGWINDIFAGRIDSSTGVCAGEGCAGIYDEPGQAVSVETAKGAATGVVIGTQVALERTEFRPPAVTSLVSRRSTALRLAIAG
ncbi:hypothetical protein MPNTM1_01318 [Mycolicibacterium parafortuitum]|uniref:hypothetical protein n=1 Tax=Mycolicibacterium parafortuitum TaxID=39692 RepID=UPI0032C4081B